VFLLVKRAAYPLEEHLSKFLWSSARLGVNEDKRKARLRKGSSRCAPSWLGVPQEQR